MLPSKMLHFTLYQFGYQDSGHGELVLRHKEDQVCTAALFLVSLLCFGGYSSSSIPETLYAAQMIPLYMLETFFNLLFAFEVRLH